MHSSCNKIYQSVNHSFLCLYCESYEGAQTQKKPTVLHFVGWKMLYCSKQLILHFLLFLGITLYILTIISKVYVKVHVLTSELSPVVSVSAPLSRFLLGWCPVTSVRFVPRHASRQGPRRVGGAP